MKTLFIYLVSCCIGSSVNAQDTTSAAKIKDYMGKKVTVCDRVSYGRLVSINTTGPTILYVGPDPDYHLALFFPEFEVQRFSFDPEKKMINKRFCATGEITTYNNKPVMYIRSESQVNEEEVNSFIYDFDKKEKN